MEKCFCNGNTQRNSIPFCAQKPFFVLCSLQNTFCLLCLLHREDTAAHPEGIIPETLAFVQDEKKSVLTEPHSRCNIGTNLPPNLGFDKLYYVILIAPNHKLIFSILMIHSACMHTSRVPALPCMCMCLDHLAAFP